MRPAPQILLSLFAAITAFAIGLAFAWPTERWLPAARWHAIFALGALPMILLAMGYFVPVLTRSAPPPRRLAIAPLGALAAGLLIVGHFLHPQPWMRITAPWLALAAVAVFAAWLARRWRGCLGRPNPCLAWYAAALALLALGLVAVGIQPLLPELARPLRLFHLHINTLGFMGLTALGTLQVLVPTVANRHDPDAMPRLTRDLKWAVTGALLIALGAAGLPGLALIGSAAYAWSWLNFGIGLLRRYTDVVLAAGNTAALLAAATTGLALAGGHGLAHAAGAVSGAAAVAVFVLGFLLPLVSGAAGQLLPVWLRPGRQDAWHPVARLQLAFGARLRAGLLFSAAALAALERPEAIWIGIVAALWLILAMARVTLGRLRTKPN